MDKFTENICKQNPKMTLICGNKECNHKFVVKSLDVCKQKVYSRVCEKCGMSTRYDTSKMFDDVIKQLKSMGVKIK